MARRKLGEVLISEGVLDEARLRAALVEQQRWGGPLGRILVDMRLVEEGALVDALSRQLGIPAVDLDRIDIPQAVIDLVPADLAEQHSLVPFSQPMKFLDVAMADPTNLGIVDELQIRTRLNVRAHLAGPKVIERAIARYYGRGFGRGRGGATIPPPYMQGAIEIAGGAPGASDSGMVIVRREERMPSVDVDVSDRDRDAEIRALQRRVSQLEALLARDEDVLRKVLGLLVEKGIASREEIVERLK